MVLFGLSGAIIRAGEPRYAFCLLGVSNKNKNDMIIQNHLQHPIPMQRGEEASLDPKSSAANVSQ